MTLDNFFTLLDKQAKPVQFSDTMAVIDANYTHTATAFRVGDQDNTADQNQGSCKILAFAQLHNMDKHATLALFGNYYRVDVLKHPNHNDHQNIRNFLAHGWDSVSFTGKALVAKLWPYTAR